MDWLLSTDMVLAQSVMGTDDTLSILGAGWSAMEAFTLPVRHPRLGVGVILTFGSNAPAGRHLVDLRLQNAYGMQLDLGQAPEGPKAPSFGRVNVDLFIEPIPEGLDLPLRRVCMAFNFDGLVLREYGLHEMMLAVDGMDVRSIGFVVRRPN